MSKSKFPQEFLEYVKSIDAKRAKTVINHILENEHITTEELKDIYGYNHPPRAIRDVREYGIPIITFRVTGKDGRNIAAYKFGNPSDLNVISKTSGRNILTATLKQNLINNYGAKCFIYWADLPPSELQVDHRIPFEIAGEAPDMENIQYFMLLSASANRAKSWACEHCKNWEIKNVEVCNTCYWAYPENYEHIAMRNIRRIDVMWQENETEEFEYLKRVAEVAGVSLQDFIKNMLRRMATKS